MAVYICPAEVVNASCAQVWQMLMHLPDDAEWVDARVERVDPPGALQAGQTLLLSSVGLGRRWQITQKINLVDEIRYVIDLRVMLPFGVVNDEHITCAPLTDQACRVQFG